MAAVEAMDRKWMRRQRASPSGRRASGQLRSTRRTATPTGSPATHFAVLQTLFVRSKLLQPQDRVQCRVWQSVQHRRPIAPVTCFGAPSGATPAAIRPGDRPLPEHTCPDAPTTMAMRMCNRPLVPAAAAVRCGPILCVRMSCRSGGRGYRRQGRRAVEHIGTTHRVRPPPGRLLRTMMASPLQAARVG